jgi:uncharacterized protein DUF6529
MRAVTSERRQKPRKRIWFIAPLAVFALVSLTMSTLAHRSAGGYPAPPFFHLFFSDTLHLKAWLATAVSMLAVFQLLTAARTFDVFHFPPSRRFWARVHRLSGYLAILLTLPIAYHCIFLLGFETTSLRVALHSVLGSALYGAFLAKVIIVRARGCPGWALAVAGGLVFAILSGLWLTSALYFFRTHAIAL